MASQGAPWAGKPHSYAGWVPNVHSHLSFSLIGTGRGPEVAALSRRYEEGELRRFVCALQRRQTDDFLAPVWWTRMFRPSATQHFLLIGSTKPVETPIGVIDVSVEVAEKPPQRSRGLDLGRIRNWGKERAGLNFAQKRRRVETACDEQGMLQGRIFVLPRQKKRDRRRRQERWLESMRTRLRSKDALSDAKLDAFLPELDREVENNSPFAVPLEFALFRTGEVRIWFEEMVAARLCKAERREVSRQCYFFIKDMVHHHVHHDDKSDQITPLTEIGTVDPDLGEELWRRDTVWSLSRAVDALTRRGKLQDLREATGILAYADAFQKTLLLYRRNHNDQSAFEPNAATYRYDFAHIRESLKVQLDQLTGRRTTLSQMLVAGLAGCIAATSLLASIVSAYNGAARGKLDIPPVLLGIPGDWLQWSAHVFVVPAIGVGAFLWFVSSLVLSEERIGAKAEPRRKLAQAVRGIANSIGTRLNWTGRTVQRWLERFYIGLSLLLLYITYAGVPYVTDFARYLGSLQISITQDAPLQTPVPAPSPSPPTVGHRPAPPASQLSPEQKGGTEPTTSPARVPTAAQQLSDG